MACVRSEAPLPLSNVMPETAAQQILQFLGLEGKEPSRPRHRCLAVANGTGRRCQHMTHDHFCSSHNPHHCHGKCDGDGDGDGEGEPTYQEALTRLSVLLHGPAPNMKRRFPEPNRCSRCGDTWKTCQCTCFCLQCCPEKHLQVPQFYQQSLDGPYQGTEGRTIVTIGCRRSWLYRHHPLNHPDCEYCLSKRPCHRVE